MFETKDYQQLSLLNKIQVKVIGFLSSIAVFISLDIAKRLARHNKDLIFNIS